MRTVFTVASASAAWSSLKLATSCTSLGTGGLGGWLGGWLGGGSGDGGGLGQPNELGGRGGGGLGGWLGAGGGAGIVADTGQNGSVTMTARTTTATTRVNATAVIGKGRMRRRNVPERPSELRAGYWLAGWLVANSCRREASSSSVSAQASLHLAGPPPEGHTTRCVRLRCRGGAAVRGGLRAAGRQAAARRYRATCVSRAKSAHVAPMARQGTQIAGKRPGTGDHAPPPPSRRTLGAPPQSGSIKGKLARERVLQPRSRWPRPGRPKRPPAEIPRDREAQQPLPQKRRPGARPQRSTAVGAQYRRVVRRAVCPAARAWCTGALPAAGRRAAPLGPIVRTLRRDDGCSPLLSPRAATHLQPPRGLSKQQLFCTFIDLPVFFLLG